MVEVDLLDFVETFKRLAKQALGKHAGEPATGGFARWKHVVIHGIRREEGHSFRETENRLEYMGEIRDVLELEKHDVPDYTTLYKSFDRFKIWVWRALLRSHWHRLMAAYSLVRLDPESSALGTVRSKASSLRANLEHSLKETMYNLLSWVRDNDDRGVDDLMNEIDHLFVHSPAEA